MSAKNLGRTTTSEPNSDIFNACFCLPVHPTGPVCFSSWPVVVFVPPEGSPVSSALYSAAPATISPPTLPAHASNKGRWNDDYSPPFMKM